MELINGVICILDSYKRPAGAGFVVSTATENLIITCAHVLGEPKPEQVTIVFQATGEQREARLIDQWWRPQEAEDVAILQVVGNLPQQVQSLPLGTAVGTVGHTIRTFGFPRAGEVEGVLGTGEALGLGAKTKAGYSLLQMRSSEITQGFSGAPLWDELRQRIIGMVVIVAMPDAGGKLGETAFATPTETLRTVCPPLLVSEVCPYRNLAAFTEADAAFFFGRQRIVDELVHNLRDEPRFLAVLGPSGCGKSSVVQAGLIPQLRQGAVPGSDLWEIIVTRPTDRSFSHLVATPPQNQQHVALIIDQFEELFVASFEAAQQESLTHLVKLLEYSPRTSIILMLRDDFYSRFVQQERLARWLKHSLVNVSPLLTHDELTAIIRGPARVIGLSYEDGLVEMMVKDAMETVNLPEEHGRAGQSTILPLLEFTLTQLWERREEGVLTRTAYERIGGVTGGLAQWANEAFFALEERQRPLARRIFTDLVYLGSQELNIPDSRRRRSLPSLYRSEGEREIISQVVQQLINARLLVTSWDRQGQEETVEIIHEALLREWGELRRWIAEDRLFLLWYQELDRKTRAWIATNPSDITQRDEDKLLRGRELVEAESWMGTRKTELSPEAQEFIQASRERQKREESRWKELYEEAERQRQIALARGLAAQADLLSDKHPRLLERSVLLAIEAMRRFPCLEADQALRDGMKLLRHHLATLSHEGSVQDVVFSPDGHLLATASSDGTAGIWEIPGGRRLASLSHERSVYDVVFSPDGHLLATASSDGTAGIWQVPSGRRLASLSHGGDVYDVVFSPDGHLLATASSDGTAGIWEMPSGRRLASLSHESVVNVVAFSPDGRLLAAACGGFELGSGGELLMQPGSVSIWNVPRNRRLATLSHQEDPMGALAFSPDGRLLATAAALDSIAEIWEMPRGRHLSTLSHEANSMNAVAFSPDGHLLATAGDDSTARIWEAPHGNHLATLSHGGGVAAVTFSPDGHLLATAGGDSTARIWEVPSGRLLAILSHQGSVEAVAFNPHGGLLATASEDKTVRIWETRERHPIALLHENGVSTVAFSPDGELLATTNGDHTEIWHATSGHHLLTLSSENDPSEVTERSAVYGGQLISAKFFERNLVFSANGRLLATTCNGNSIAAGVWETSSGRRLVRVIHREAINTVALSPDGHLLATASDDGTARIWEVPSGRGLATLTHRGRVMVVTFSPDGELLATTSEDGTIRICEISSGHQLVQVNGEEIIYALVFGPDRHLFATTSNDHAVGVWEAISGHRLATLSHSSVVHSTVFSPDGRFLATASSDGTAGVWEPLSGHRLATLLHQGLVLDVSFSPDGRSLATASDDGTAGVWEVPSGRQLARITHDKRVEAVTFSPKGRYIATVSDNIARLWFWQPEDLIAEACSRLTRNFTLNEWAHYIGSETYRKTCPDLP